MTEVQVEDDLNMAEEKLKDEEDEAEEEDS